MNFVIILKIFQCIFSWFFKSIIMPEFFIYYAQNMEIKIENGVKFIYI